MLIIKDSLINNAVPLTITTNNVSHPKDITISTSEGIINESYSISDISLNCQR